MPTFQFDEGNAFDIGSNASINFTDATVPFTLSTSGNFGGGQLFADGGGAQQILIGDSNTIGGDYVLDIGTANTSGTNFGASGGNISLQLGTSINGGWDIVFVHETNTALNQTFTVNSLNTGSTLSFATTENFSEIRFSYSTPGLGGFGELTINSLTATITCYLAGTGIATPTGRVAVETLQPGDEILTADGGTTTVRWLGIQPIDTKTATPAKANPICFTAGSIAPNVPSRDLFVSPDHAMDIDGILYNATALVNGRSIYQVAQMPMDGFTYYHIDTGSHELVLAEGAASETYLDAVGRDAFINGHEQADAPIISEMSVPRIVARRMVPQHVVDALAERADALGYTAAAKVA
ncbi:Hint domain-containing protein [uncultured Tateyamaria sp.]|uniref:Hint domain-containing protein n=4 Tax=uncultured Tateyamaria sp. TaxID=455651 RepID=UPI002636DFD5|nr:Hint domain-containing protein [uncultured Tateyamaria sp.]